MHREISKRVRRMSRKVGQFIGRSSRQRQQIDRLEETQNLLITQLTASRRLAKQERQQRVQAERICADLRRELKSLRMGIDLEMIPGAQGCPAAALESGAAHAACNVSVAEVAGEAWAHHQESVRLRRQVSELQQMIRWRREPSVN